MQVPRDDKVERVQGAGYRNVSSGGGITTIKLAMLLVVTIVVSIVAVNVLFLGNYVSKADDTQNLSAMSDTIAKTRADLTTTVTNLQNTMNALPSSISGQVNASVTQSTSQLNAQISSMQSQVNNMAGVVKVASDKADQTVTAMNALTTQVNDLKAQLEAVKADIVVLKAGTGSGTNGTVFAITAKIKSTSNVLVASDNATLVGSFRLTLTNNTVADVNDIILDVTTQTDTIMGTHTMALSGGGTSWQKQGFDPNFADFINSTWGLKVAANSTVTLYLTLTVTDSGTVDYLVRYGGTGVPYSVDVAVQ